MLLEQFNPLGLLRWIRYASPLVLNPTRVWVDCVYAALHNFVAEIYQTLMEP
jgi:hypothetical protein